MSRFGDEDKVEAFDFAHEFRIDVPHGSGEVRQSLFDPRRDSGVWLCQCTWLFQRRVQPSRPATRSLATLASVLLKAPRLRTAAHLKEPVSNAAIIFVAPMPRGRCIFDASESSEYETEDGHHQPAQRTGETVACCRPTGREVATRSDNIPNGVQGSAIMQACRKPGPRPLLSSGRLMDTQPAECGCRESA